MSVDANLSGRIVTTSRRQRTAALQSRSSHDYRLLHPYLVRHLASDALRLWRAAVRSFSLCKEPTAHAPYADPLYFAFEISARLCYK